MPHDLPVSSVAAVPSTATTSLTEDRVAATAPSAPATTARPFPNPSLRLDAGLGIVVLEFYDGLGEITTSIPSQRILQAYRAHTEPLPGAAEKPGAAASTAQNTNSAERFA